MSLWDIYKAKKLGMAAESFFDTALGSKLGGNFEWVTDKVPYIKRPSGGSLTIAGKKAKDELVGGSVVWNQIASSISPITIPAGGQQTPTFNAFTAIEGHKYLAGINQITSMASNVRNAMVINWSNNTRTYDPFIGENEALTASVRKMIVSCPAGGSASLRLWCHTPSEAVTYKDSQIYDLTLMFGATIADYIYSLEQANPGSGIDKLKAWGFFADDYYQQDENGSLQSVNAIAHKMRDVNDVIIGNYTLADITLYGIPKLDANNNLYYDGDVYSSDGEVTRNWGVRSYQSGDATNGSTMITDGTNTVYKLASPVIESASVYSNPQAVDPNGTEEYVDGLYAAGTRDVAIPVGHNTQYQVAVE